MPDIFQLAYEPIFQHDLMTIADIMTTREFRLGMDHVYEVELGADDHGEAIRLLFSGREGRLASLLDIECSSGGAALSVRFLDGYREAISAESFDGCGAYLYYRGKLWPVATFVRIIQPTQPYYIGTGLVYKR